MKRRNFVALLVVSLVTPTTLLTLGTLVSPAFETYHHGTRYWVYKRHGYNLWATHQFTRGELYAHDAWRGRGYV